MPITFRYDAAAVVPPSNQSTRKYGQSLVLQEQQRKYQAQQAGYDRLFQLGRDRQQNVFQTTRDMQQTSDQAARDKMLNQFQVGRDKTLFEQQQQEAEAARQRQFMDDARKQQSGIIMDDINNGLYDPSTSRQLQQNLVAEAEALGNQNLDATQRAEVLAKIRAARALLTANRMEPKPQPTPQEVFDQSVVVENGIRGQIGKDGTFVPLPEPKSNRPPTFNEFYNDPKNADKFQKDLDSKMQSMQDAIDLNPPKEGETAPKVTPETALKELQKEYEFRQKALGLVGTPTEAPALPGQAPASATSPPMRSILETPPQQDLTVQPPHPGRPPSPTDAPTEEELAQWHSAMDQEYGYQDRASGTPAMSGLNIGGVQPAPMPKLGGGGPPTAPMPELGSPGGMPPSNMPELDANGENVKGGITMQAASDAAKQYEAAAPQLQGLQSQLATIEQQIRSVSTARGGPNRAKVEGLKKERERVKASLKAIQQSMQEADKTARGYYDQEIAKQPAAKNLAKAGKRPQDFAEAEFQLRNLAKQYPDMSKMPADAKKKLQELMAVIQSGR